MGREFESELAARITQRHMSPAGRRTTLLFMSVVSCALMIGASAAVLSMKATAEVKGPTTYTDLFSNTDYLVDSDGSIALWTDPLVDPVDEVILVKKNSTLKFVEFYPPGNPPTVNTKFVYTVNVKLKDLSLFTEGVAGMVVSQLTVYGMEELNVVPIVVSTAVAVNGVPVTNSDDQTPLDMAAYVDWGFTEGVTTVGVMLPNLEGTDTVGYSDGDMVSIFIMWKVPLHGLVVECDETPFPAYQVNSSEELVA
jgi:hypothetical protein